MREGVTERGNALDGWVSVLANIFRVIEAKETLDLVKSCVLLDSESVRVQVVDVLDI